MRTSKRTGLRFILVALAVLFTLVFVALAGIRLATGKSLGVRTLLGDGFGWAANFVKMATQAPAIAERSRGDFTNIIFLHHSTGNNLVNHGKLRQRLSEQGYVFYDHDRNHRGLRGPIDVRPGFNYNVPGDNTDPDGMVTIFRQPLLPVPLNTFSMLMQHEVIIIKSCFEPGNIITSDAQVKQYQDWYVEIRGVMQAHPEKMFIILTIPPLNPSQTNAEQAARARIFANWLKSDEFLAGSTNIAVFDFFDMLAESDPAAPDYNMLRTDYREGGDSHPNRTANEAIGPNFAAFVMETASRYRAAVANK